MPQPSLGRHSVLGADLGTADASSHTVLPVITDIILAFAPLIFAFTAASLRHAGHPYSKHDKTAWYSLHFCFLFIFDVFHTLNNFPKDFVSAFVFLA